MKKVKYLFLLAALVMTTAIPASAAGKDQVEVVTYSARHGNVVDEEYQIITEGEIKTEAVGDDAEISASKKVTVTNPNKIDKKAPVLNSISLSSTKVQTNKSGLDMYVKLTEAESGFNYGYVYFANANKQLVSFYVSGSAYNYDTKKKAYKSYLEFSDSNVGKYTFESAFFYDNNGNLRSYNKSSKDCPTAVKKLSFTVTKGTVSSTAKITSLDYSQTKLAFKEGDSPSKTLKTKMSLGLQPSGSKIDHVYIGLRYKVSDYSWRGRGVSLYTPNSSGKYEYTWEFYNDPWYFGSWYLNEVKIYFKNGDIVSLTADNKKIGSRYTKKKVTVSGPVSNDTSFPSIKTATFKDSKVKLENKKDGTVNLVFDVSDKGSGVYRVYAVFYDSEQGKSLTGSIFLKTSKKSGKITVPITISRYAGSGKYKIERITIADAAGNETCYVANKEYYTDSKTTKYLNFTSDMKDMTIVVKNTYK